MQTDASTNTIAHLNDTDSAEARARRRREQQANMSASEKLKDNATVVVAVFAGVITSLVKFIASSITGSSAMFSEGIHSMVDAINDSLLLVGNKMSKRKPDVEHPFGYGPEVYFYSHAVALVIFVLGGGFAIYEGIRSVMEGGHPIENPLINYIVLGIGIVLEGFSLSVAVRTVNKARGDSRIMSYIRNSKSPTNITVFLEDSAAVLGMLVALVGNIASTATGIYVIDSWASVIIGCIMAFIAIILLKETYSLVIGEGLSVEEVKDVIYIVESDPSVIKCGRVLSLYLGPDDLLINLDVTFKDDQGESGILVAIDRIEDEIMSEYPQTTRIFIEPESLNQVYRQRRDRKLQFQAYEEAKRLEGATDERVATKHHDEDTLAAAYERRAQRREAIARAYHRLNPKEAISDAALSPSEENQQTPSRKKLFDDIPSISGERILLNRVVDTDASALSDLIGNPLVQRFLPANMYGMQTNDVHDTIHALYADHFENKRALFLAVRMKETGELAGLVDFYGLRENLRKVSVGCRIREQWWGMDLEAEATRLMVGYLYSETEIEIVTASTMVEDKDSARALEAADFIRTSRGVEEDWGYPEPTIVDKWFC